MSPPIVSKLFRRNDFSYNLGSNSSFALPNVKFVFHGSESISYLGPKSLDIVLLELQELTLLNPSKEGIRMAKKSCRCRLCKQHISNLGFITNISITSETNFIQHGIF